MKSEVLAKDQKKIIPLIWTGEENEINYQINLVGQGSDVTLLMLLLGKNQNSLKVTTNIIHQGPDTKSRVIIKGALDDMSKIDFEGKVVIEKGAKRSNAWLAAHLLLLSNSASGSAVPNLEISENEVKAGHASTVGKVSDTELFYLMSRGLTEKASTKLIVQGFLESILNEFPLKDAKIARKNLKWI